MMSSPCARAPVICESSILGIAVILKHVKDETLAVTRAVTVCQDIAGMSASFCDHNYS